MTQITSAVIATTLVAVTWDIPAQSTPAEIAARFSIPETGTPDPLPSAGLPFTLFAVLTENPLRKPVLAGGISPYALLDRDTW